MRGRRSNCVQHFRDESSKRVFQTLPRHLRRRTASHDVRRVPVRLQVKARAEVRTTARLRLSVPDSTYLADGPCKEEEEACDTSSGCTYLSGTVVNGCLATSSCTRGTCISSLIFASMDVFLFSLCYPHIFGIQTSLKLSVLLNITKILWLLVTI